MSKIRIGIVGSGGMAGNHAEQFAGLDAAEVVAIASRNVQTGAQLAKRYDAEFVPAWQDLVERESLLDGVVITTHNDSHGEIAIGALGADKHVFTEYPLARSIDEGEQAFELAKSNKRVLRISHPEIVSNLHKAIKRKRQELGNLLLTSFLRLTPGRGARPEILFNLSVSGPPAHFFIYQIYPAVDLFGSVSWVEGGAVYEDLTNQGTYDRFVNTVNVGFKAGGIGQWTWAGGIEIKSAEQRQHYVLTGGTIFNEDGWRCSTRLEIEEVQPLDAPSISLQELWLSEIQDGDTVAAHADAATALEAIKVSLSAERSMHESRRIVLP
jgi:predicted dehydrogenase